MWWILGYRKSKAFGLGLERWVEFRCVEMLAAVCRLWFFIHSDETSVYNVTSWSLYLSGEIDCEQVISYLIAVHSFNIYLSEY